MFTDSARLTYSIQDKRVTIMDNINHRMFVRDASSYAEDISLPAEVIFSHVQTIQRCLVGNKVTWLMYKPFTKEKGESVTKIMEFENSVRFIVEGKCAEYKNGCLFGERNFNVTRLLRDINFAYSLVHSAGTLLHPDVDYCRFYADSNVFVVKSTSCNLIVQCADVHPGYLNNVICGDNIYKKVKVVLDDDYCRFYDEDNKLILIVPTDFSMRTYFDVTEEDNDDGFESDGLGE